MIRSRRPSLYRIPALVLAALLPAACSAPQPATKDHFYALAATVKPLPVGPSPGATLLVNDLATRGFLGGRRVVFRTAAEPLEVRRYPLHLWEEPPGRALAAELVASLRAAGFFEFVITPAQRTRSDYVLGGELARFEHLPTAAPPRVLADFTLTLMRGNDRRSILSKRYRGEEPTQGPTPEDMIIAFNRLSGRLIRKVVEDLRDLKR